MGNPAPGFLKHPDYRVSIAPSSRRVRVRVGDTVIAETRQALQVNETGHPPVWYVPMADVDSDVIAPTSSRTHCPFKGRASYWSVHAGGKSLPDAMWSYLSPYDECEALAGYAAFYPDRVDLDIEEDAQRPT